jgi:hypothetical protein
VSVAPLVTLYIPTCPYYTSRSELKRQKENIPKLIEAGIIQQYESSWSALVNSQSLLEFRSILPKEATGPN